MSAWSPHYVKDQERLKRVHQIFTRMVPGLKGLENVGRLESLNLMTLVERRNRSDIVELFKISKGLSVIPWNSFFRADNSDRTRGHSMKLAKERFRLDIRKHFFSQRVVNRWNGRSGEVVSAGTVEAFKRRLDELRMEKKDLQMDYYQRLLDICRGTAHRCHLSLVGLNYDLQLLVNLWFHFQKLKLSGTKGSLSPVPRLGTVCLQSFMIEPCLCSLSKSI